MSAHDDAVHLFDIFLAGGEELWIISGYQFSQAAFPEEPAGHCITGDDQIIAGLDDGGHQRQLHRSAIVGHAHLNWINVDVMVFHLMKGRSRFDLKLNPTDEQRGH